MSNKPVHIVFTTIFDPAILDDLAANLRAFGRVGEVVVWIIGDTKTPPACGARCARWLDAGMDFRYVDIPAQDAWGRRFPELYARFPYANETRRNIGYLMALEAGCETLIAIDDDNFPVQGEDFIGRHKLDRAELAGEVLQEPSGFHNVCEYIEFDDQRLVYPRGFPFGLRAQRQRNTSGKAAAAAGLKVGVNFGLWLVEPDIDATTWINGRILGLRYRGPTRTVLDHGTWSPINTQNTAVARELVPAFLCVPMGFPVPGGKIQRYGDIWGGYFLQAVMRGTAWRAAFGAPIVEHRRNPHNYVDDLRHEFWGMVLTDWLLEQLRESFAPTSPGIEDRVEELAIFLESVALPKLPAWTPSEMREFLRETSRTLSLWQKACRVCASR